jgi:hypothetical protein
MEVLVGKMEASILVQKSGEICCFKGEFGQISLGKGKERKNE